MSHPAITDKHRAVMEEAEEEWPSLDDAITEARKGADRDTDKTVTMTITTQAFHVPIEGAFRPIPPGSYLIGEVYLSTNVPGISEVRPHWELNLAPLYAPYGAEHALIGIHVDASLDPVPVVSGEWFGRDDDVAILPWVTIPNPEVVGADSVGADSWVISQ